MKKSLIALAVGAAFVAPAAYADVTLSGSINMGLALAKSGDTSNGVSNSITPTTTGGGSLTKTQVTTNYSNITIGSMEDLGGGLKLDFAYQIIANVDNNGAINNRNSHIGLVGDTWGGVWYGTNENLYERYFYTIDPLDGAAGIGGNLQMLGTPGYGTVFDAPNGNPNNCGSVDVGKAVPASGIPAGLVTASNLPTGCAGFYRRTENTVWYDSPNWGGFTFGAYQTLSAYKSNGGTLSNPYVQGIGGKYVGPTLPIQAWIAFERHKDMNGLGVITGGALSSQSALPSSTSDKGIQVGAGYTLGDIFIFANFEQLKYTADGLAAATDITEYKRNAWSIGGKWNIATGYIGAQYIQAQDGKCTSVGGGCDAHDTGARMIGVGYYHTLSKQTQAYIMATWVNNKDLASYALAGAGTPNNGPGADQQAYTIGLKHSF
jgi:predicted porin